MNRILPLFLLGLLLIFSRCEYLVHPKKDEEKTWHVYFNKSVDDTYFSGELAEGNSRIDLKLAERILSAESSVDFCFYEIESDTILGALKTAYNNGIQVRIITDDGYLDEVSDLLEMNIPLISDSAGGVYISKDMHNKFAIFDNEWVWTGSYNATPNGIFRNANNAIEFKSEEIANAYLLEFEQMWGSSTTTPNPEYSKFHTHKIDYGLHEFELDDYPLEVYFSPKNNSKEAVLDAISMADFEIFFCIFSFTDDSISATMETQLSDVSGLVILGLFDETQAGSQYSEIDKMKTWGEKVEVRVDAVTDTSGAEAFLHHKYLLIDAEHSDSDPILITGSTNWSNNGFNYNDENLIITYHPEIVNLYLQEFMARFAEGDQPE